MSRSKPPVSSAATPPLTGAGIRISDANRGMWSYVIHRKLLKTVVHLALLVAWEALMVWLLVKANHINRTVIPDGSTGDNSPAFFIGWAMVFPLLVTGGSFLMLKERFENEFLQEFAAANGYTFAKKGKVDETYGTIFRMSDGRRVSDLVSGTYAGCNLRMFLFEATVRKGSGKDISDDEYKYTVIELDLHGRLPDLLMVNKQGRSLLNDVDFQSMFGIKHTITLEGDFNRYFTLYAPDSMTVEALEVFSPDTMALMEDGSRHYTVEFAGNRIYIYVRGHISTARGLTEMFTLAKQLMAKVEPLASRLAHDSAIAAPAVDLYRSRATFTRHTWEKLYPILVVLAILVGIVIGLSSS